MCVGRACTLIGGWKILPTENAENFPLRDILLKVSVTDPTQENLCVKTV